MSIIRPIARAIVPPLSTVFGAALPWESGGGGAVVTLDLSTGGTFARSSEASYYLGAPTDGSSAFLAWAATGTRRSADTRGDGIAASLLMERSATNLVQYSEDVSQASWTLGPGVTATYGLADPDGGTGAVRLQTPSGTFGVGETSGTTDNIASSWVSAWIRAQSGSDTPNLNAYFSTTGRLALSTSVTTTWTRLSRGRVSGVNEEKSVVPIDGRDWSGIGGVVAGARDSRAWGMQREVGYYPTSYIRTTAASVTRAQDTLSYASGNYPAGFLTSGFVVVFAPDASSAEIISANEDWRLVQVGANDYLRIRNNAGACKAELVCGAAVVASLTITFSRAQALTITARPSAGSLAVSGATTGDGTNTGAGAAWASSSTLYIGGDSGGTNSVTGRYVGAAIRQA